MITREQIARIEFEVDPDGILRQEVRLGQVTRENVAEMARDTVDGLNAVWADEGGCRATVAEIQEYYEYLLGEEGR